MRTVAALLFLFTCLESFESSSATPVCTNGFTLINNKCLKLLNTPVNHKAAEISCSSFGATLVTVKNDHVSWFFLKLSSLIQDFWTKGFRTIKPLPLLLEVLHHSYGLDYTVFLATLHSVYGMMNLALREVTITFPVVRGFQSFEKNIEMAQVFLWSLSDSVFTTLRKEHWLASGCVRVCKWGVWERTHGLCLWAPDNFCR